VLEDAESMFVDRSYSAVCPVARSIYLTILVVVVPESFDQILLLQRSVRLIFYERRGRVVYVLRDLTCLFA